MNALLASSALRRTALLAGLAVAATAIAFWGVNVTALSTANPTELLPAPTAAVVSIAVAHAEPIPRPGPNQAVFQASCTVCHSTRMALNQPPFAEEQWTEVVDKMIRNYGAAVGPEQRREVIAYLTAISATQAAQLARN